MEEEIENAKKIIINFIDDFWCSNKKSTEHRRLRKNILYHAGTDFDHFNEIDDINKLRVVYRKIRKYILKKDSQKIYRYRCPDKKIMNRKRILELALCRGCFVVSFLSREDNVKEACNELSNRGLIKRQKARGKYVYKITEKGENYLNNFR